MSESRLSGTVPINIAGPRVLRFDWSALERLRSELGKEYEKAISQAMCDADTNVLARVLEIGLSPAVGADEIKKLYPPPAMPMVIASIRAAMNISYFGSKEVPADLAENPLRRPRPTLLKRLIGLLFGRE